MLTFKSNKIKLLYLFILEIYGAISQKQGQKKTLIDHLDRVG